MLLCVLAYLRGGRTSLLLKLQVGLSWKEQSTSTGQEDSLLSNSAGKTFLIILRNKSHPFFLVGWFFKMGFLCVALAAWDSLWNRDQARLNSILKSQKSQKVSVGSHLRAPDTQHRELRSAAFPWHFKGTILFVLKTQLFIATTWSHWNWEILR